MSEDIKSKIKKIVADTSRGRKGNQEASFIDDLGADSLTS